MGVADGHNSGCRWVLQIGVAGTGIARQPAQASTGTCFTATAEVLRARPFARAASKGHQQGQHAASKGSK
eukprot:361579-Chlamydomonas_euryale.AAC.1